MNIDDLLVPTDQPNQPDQPEPAPSCDAPRLTCWRAAPFGYIVSAPTNRSIPAGVYKLDLDRNGAAVFTPADFKSDDLLDLDSAQQRRVLNRVEKFWSSESKYRAHGLMYKTGIFLYGPPGGGKTATLKLVANKIVQEHAGIVVLGTSLGPVGVNNCLAQFRMVEPARRLLVLLEDLEEYVETWKETNVLSMLDGEDQIDNVVFVATSNFPQRLGKRFLNRPSRFDEIIEIGMPDNVARRKYLAHSFPEFPDAWIELTEGLGLSHLRELVVATQCLDMDAEETIKRLRGQKKIPTCKDTNLDDMGFATRGK